jgi:hypothetical protein
MDINPLISDLNKYKDELFDCIEIAIGFKELTRADEYIAHGISEIKGESHSDRPFHQVAQLYNLPLVEVVRNIRDFTNKAYKAEFISFLENVKDIEFESEKEGIHKED